MSFGGLRVPLSLASHDSGSILAAKGPLAPGKGPSEVLMRWGGCYTPKTCDQQMKKPRRLKNGATQVMKGQESPLQFTSSISSTCSRSKTR